MLVLEGLRLSQGGFSLRADLSLPQGSRCAVIGPSGAGKSTLLAAIAGFLAPAEGRILWQGKDITGLPPGERPMSILFQDNNLFPHLTITQNLALGLRADLRLSLAERDRVSEVLAQVGLAGLGGRKPASLSGGQIGRAALARALLRARPLLLLDEPFSALGPALKAEMLDLVARITRQTAATLLMVTHDPKDALAIAGQTILVDGGRAEPPEPTRALLANPPQALRDYLGS